MPWEKNFNVADVRHRAMELYWERGYDGTSMAELLEHLGINRGSFYATYESKRALFLATLRDYLATELNPVLAEASALDARSAVASVFDTFRKRATGDTGGRGCFLVNSALEFGKRDDEVAELVSMTTTRLESFFTDRIRESQKSGELRAELRPLDTARALTALLFGMRLMERASASDAQLKSIGRQAERMLD